MKQHPELLELMGIKSIMLTSVQLYFKYFASIWLAMISIVVMFVILWGAIMLLTLGTATIITPLLSPLLGLFLMATITIVIAEIIMGKEPNLWSVINRLKARLKSIIISVLSVSLIIYIGLIPYYLILLSSKEYLKPIMIFPLLIRFVFALAWTLIYISLSLRFSMVIQIAISESVSAIDTLKRSWKLTKGLVLSIFLVLFILGLINFFSQLALYQFVKPSSNVLYLSLSPIINLLLYPFTLIALVLYYFNVRAMREDLIIPTLEIDFAYRKRKKLDDVSKKESEKIRKNLKVNKKKIDKTPNKHSTKPPTKYPAKKKVEHIITKTEVFEEELAIGIITLDTPPLPDLTTNTDETTDITAYKSIELVDVKMENENPKSKIDTLKYNTVEIIDDKEKLEELKINKGKKFVVEDWKLIKLSTTTIENDGEIGETNDYGDINLSAKVSLAETTPSEIDDNVMGYGQVELSSYTEPEPSIPTIQETEKSIEILTPLEETPISDEFKLENVTDSLGDATKEESGFDFGGLDLAGVTPEVEGTPELEPIISEIEPVNIEKITSTPTIEISNDLGISSDFAPIDLDTPIEIPTKKKSSLETISIDC